MRRRSSGPPYGAYAVGVPDGGLPSIIWSLDTNNWQNKNAPEKTVKAATTDVRPGDIILIHDIHKPSVDASPEIIGKLKEAGLHPGDRQRALRRAARARTELLQR